MIRKIAISLLFIITISTYSQQEKINNYKYVIVPQKFKFLKSADQYQTSSLTKFLLKKKGFIVFLSSDRLPNELFNDKCKALTANVIDNSSMFTMKSTIQIKDCFGTILYTSKKGRSKEKDYKKGYHESIRSAYATMSDLEYKYNPIKETIELKKDSKVDLVMPVNKVVPEKVLTKVKEVAPERKEITKEIFSPSTKTETLYAQVKPNGFQLVNTVPSIIFHILKTKVKDVFIIKGKNGIMYKNNNTWVAEYYEDDILVIKQYMIKF